MDKKRYVNKIRTNDKTCGDELVKHIYEIAVSMFGFSYNKVIPDIHGDTWMIMDADEDGFKIFRELVEYKFPNVCDFDI